MKENIEDKKKRLVELITDCLSIREACERIKVSRSTYYVWKRGDRAFCTSLKKAFEIRDEEIVETAEKSLLEKVTGKYVDKVVKIKRKTDGKMVVVEERHSKEWIEPDTAAIIFTLTNRSKGRWKRNIIDESTTEVFKEIILKTSIAKKDENRKQVST